MLKYATVSEVKKGFAKVIFDEDFLASDWLPLIVRKTKSDKESWPLEINEHVVCLMDEYCETGVIIGSIYSATDMPDEQEDSGKFRKSFSDGTVIEYNKSSHILKLEINGTIQLQNKSCEVECSEDLRIISNGKVLVSANEIIAKASSKASIEAPIIELKGNLKIEGNISTNGNFDSTGEIKSQGVSLKNHVHAGVQPGSGITGLPQ